LPPSHVAAATDRDDKFFVAHLLGGDEILMNLRRGYSVAAVLGRMLVGCPEVGGAVAVEAGARNVLGKDDADRNEDGATAGRVRHGDFEAWVFWRSVAAA